MKGIPFRTLRVEMTDGHDTGGLVKEGPVPESLARETLVLDALENRSLGRDSFLWPIHQEELGLETAVSQNLEGAGEIADLIFLLRTSEL